MPWFEVATECPVHKKLVFIRIEARSAPEAEKKVLGMVIDCPWGPIDAKGHKFVVGFRAGKEEILGVSTLPWKPATIISTAPSITPIKPLPGAPLETLYYISAEDAERQISKSRWWKR